MIFWNKLLKTGYLLVKGYDGWKLQSRNKIPQTGNFHDMFHNKHGMSRTELKDYVLKNKNFIALDEFRFEIMDELVND